MTAAKIKRENREIRDLREKCRMEKGAEVLCAVFGISREFPGFQVLTLVRFHGFHAFHRSHVWVGEIPTNLAGRNAGARLC